MEAIVSAHTVMFAVLGFHVAGVLFLGVLLVRGEVESRRTRRELESMLDNPLDQAASPIGPSAS